MQVENVAGTEIVKKVWKGSEGGSGSGSGRSVWVHGWVFDIESGLLRDLNISKGRGTIPKP